MNNTKRGSEMPKKSEVYRCDKCGALVAALKDSEGVLSCCETPMAEVTPGEAKRLVHDMQRPGTP
jgi:desulfoferrodoxin-like iron-binding protein